MFTYSVGSLPSYFHDYRVSTRMDAELSLPWLWNMNYDAGEYLNNSVDPLFSVMPQASILTVSSHGGPGFVVCPDPHSEYAPRYTWLTGKKYAACSYYSRALEEQSTLTKTKLMIFASCQSALSSNEYGSLLTEAVNRGADAALGWKVEIPANIESNNVTSHWLQYFFEACYFLHSDVETAAETASTRLKSEFPLETDAVEALGKYFVYAKANTTITIY